MGGGGKRGCSTFLEKIRNKERKHLAYVLVFIYMYMYTHTSIQITQTYRTKYASALDNLCVSEEMRLWKKHRFVLITLHNKYL